MTNKKGFYLVPPIMLATMVIAMPVIFITIGLLNAMGTAAQLQPLAPMDGNVDVLEAEEAENTTMTGGDTN